MRGIRLALLDFLTLRLDGQRYPRLSGGSHVLGTIVIGCFYFESPERILGTFGLKMLHRQVQSGIPLHNVGDYAFRTQRI
jgi:hypothetical protein